MQLLMKTTNHQFCFMRRMAFSACLSGSVLWDIFFKYAYYFHIANVSEYTTISILMVKFINVVCGMHKMASNTRSNLDKWRKISLRRNHTYVPGYTQVLQMSFKSFFCSEARHESNKYIYYNYTYKFKYNQHISF